MIRFQEINAFLKKRIVIINSTLEGVIQENIGLRRNIDNYRKLLRESQEKAHRMEKLLMVGVEEIKKAEISDDFSFQSQANTLLLTDHGDTVDYWIAKRDKRREIVTKRSRRHYSLDMTKNKPL